MTLTHRLLTLTLASMLLRACPAIAADMAIGSLPERGMVNVSGTVLSIQNEKQFTLQDKSGTVEVEVTSNDSAVLKTGDKVRVRGDIEKGEPTKILATRVTPKKGLTNSVADALSRTTNLAVEKAVSKPISDLPSEGKIKLNGTVENVENPKKFTLYDSSGSVEVEIRSEESMLLSPGAQVTVLGYVNDRPLLGKNIHATHVIVTAEAH